MKFAILLPSIIIALIHSALVNTMQDNSMMNRTVPPEHAAAFEDFIRRFEVSASDREMFIREFNISPASFRGLVSSVQVGRSSIAQSPIRHVTRANQIGADTVSASRVSANTESESIPYSLDTYVYREIMASLERAAREHNRGHIDVTFASIPAGVTLTTHLIWYAISFASIETVRSFLRGTHALAQCGGHIDWLAKSAIQKFLESPDRLLVFDLLLEEGLPLQQTWNQLIDYVNNHFITMYPTEAMKRVLRAIDILAARGLSLQETHTQQIRGLSTLANNPHIQAQLSEVLDHTQQIAASQALRTVPRLVETRLRVNADGLVRVFIKPSTYNSL